MSGYGPRLSKIIAALTDCLCETIAKDGGGAACWCGFYPGQTPSWDYCGECSSRKCGMAYVVLDSMYPSDSLPNPSLTPQHCGSPLAVTFRVGVLRCVPQMEEDGSLPNEEELLEAGLAIVADAAAIWSVVSCCLDEDVFVGQYTSLGPEGGCAGGEWTVTVGL